MLLAKLGIKIDKQSSFRWWKKFLKTTALIISIIINLLATFTWQKLKGGVPTILALKENHKDVQIEIKCNPCKPCSFTALAYIASIAMFGNYQQNNNVCGVFELNKSYFIFSVHWRLIGTIDYTMGASHYAVIIDFTNRIHWHLQSNFSMNSIKSLLFIFFFFLVTVLSMEIVIHTLRQLLCC